MRFASIFLLAALSAPGQTSSASIQGTVLDAKTAKAIPAAWVSANRTAVPPLSKHVKSGGDGSFAVSGLTAGTYSVCVQVAGEEFLDSCQWGAVPTNVTVSAGQVLTGISIRLTAASVLNIQVTDAPNVLSQPTADGRHPDLTLGVWGPHGVFYPAHPVGPPPGSAVAPPSGSAVVSIPHPPAAIAPKAAPITYGYRLAVPFDTALNFSIASHDLNLADSTGAALPANASLQAFQHATGDASPQNFAFSILGLK